jgi:hypothetical protein
MMRERAISTASSGGHNESSMICASSSSSLTPGIGISSFAALRTCGDHVD